MYQKATELVDVFAAIDETQIAGRQTFVEENQSIVFVQVIRAR